MAPDGEQFRADPMGCSEANFHTELGQLSDKGDMRLL